MNIRQKIYESVFIISSHKPLSAVLTQFIHALAAAAPAPPPIAMAI
jgi:hypothetical protein